LIKALERRAHGLHGCKHDLQPDLHRCKSAGRDAGQVFRAIGLEHSDGLGACDAQFVKRRALRIGRLNDLGNAFDRPVGQLRRVVTANLGCAPLGAVCSRRAAPGQIGRDIGVIAVNAVVDIVMCTPEAFARLIAPMRLRSSAEILGLSTRLRDRPRQYDRNPVHASG